MAADSYDAIVVGGGHNGLVAAAYLARTGAKTLGPGGARDHRRRRHDRGALARRPRVPGDAALLRDVAPPGDDHERPPARAARLQDLPDGPVLPGVPRGRLAHLVRGGLAARLRRD